MQVVDLVAEPRGSLPSVRRQVADVAFAHNRGSKLQVPEGVALFRAESQVNLPPGEQDVRYRLQAQPREQAQAAAVDLLRPWVLAQESVGADHHS